VPRSTPKLLPSPHPWPCISPPVFLPGTLSWHSLLRNESSVSSSSWLWLDLTKMLLCLSGDPKTSGHHKHASRFLLIDLMWYDWIRDKWEITPSNPTLLEGLLPWGAQTHPCPVIPPTLGHQSHVSRIQGVPRGGVDDIWDENQQVVHRPHLAPKKNVHTLSKIKSQMSQRVPRRQDKRPKINDSF
jgi:hypothetical protein